MHHTTLTVELDSRKHGLQTGLLQGNNRKSGSDLTPRHQWVARLGCRRRPGLRGSTRRGLFGGVMGAYWLEMANAWMLRLGIGTER